MNMDKAEIIREKIEHKIHNHKNGPKQQIENANVTWVAFPTKLYLELLEELKRLRKIEADGRKTCDINRAEGQ